MRKVVVVGAGLAGLRAAQRLREAGFDGELTLVGDEERRPYTRPPLSKELLAGAMAPEDCAFDCDGLDVSWQLGQAASGLDARRRVVSLADGASLDYDGLVIATGRRAREWPDLPELDGMFTLRSLDDALALCDAVKAGPRVAIVGAGFIGCEVAATLRQQGVDVTLLELGKRPMPALGPIAGERAARLHREHGVTLRLEAVVEGFEGRRAVEAIRLADGERVQTDLVLLALGSVPNTEWLRGSGLRLHRGAVLCDANCAALGADGVVAAGDVAAWPHPHAPGPIWVEHWTHAGAMASHAAANLLAQPEQRTAFAPVPSFWSDQYDVNIKSAGLLGQATSFEVVEAGEDSVLVVEGKRDDELMGAVTFNHNRALIGYRRRLMESLAGQ